MSDLSELGINAKQLRRGRLIVNVLQTPSNVIGYGVKRACNSMPIVLSMFVFMTAFSSLWFAYSEDHTLIEGLYWNSATAFTVGYGDLSPKSQIGMLVTSILIPLWFLTVTLFVVNLLRVVVEDIHQWTDREQRLLLGALAQLTHNVAVIGRSIGRDSEFLDRYQYDPIKRELIDTEEADTSD